MEYPPITSSLQKQPHKRTVCSQRKVSHKSVLISFFAAMTVVLGVSLPCCTSGIAYANSESISGTCYIECTNPEIDGAAGGNTFIVRFPQYGIETTGYCISGPLYGTPLPGNYPFKGTLSADGGYRITIDCSGADMYENHYSPLGAQNVGDFTIYIHGSIEVIKESTDAYKKAVPEATLEGACYELRDLSGKAIATLTTNKNGKAKTTNIPVGKYTLHETKPSYGYTFDNGPHAITVKGGETTQVNSKENPLCGSIGLKKSSTLPAITDANSCYTLKGATYGIYSNKTCTKELQRIVTDYNGEGRSDASLWPGTYWIKEISAPEGFVLNDEVYSVTLTVEQASTGKLPCVKAKDEPQLAPAEIILKKIDAETGQSTAQGDAHLSGAVFLVEHYAGVYESPEKARTSGNEPLFTWNVTTDEDGKASIDQALLPCNSKGSGLPLGTLVIKETQAPLGYLLPDNPAIAQPITFEKGDLLGGIFNAPNIAEQAIKGNISIIKVGNKEGSAGNQSIKQPLKDVAFDIICASTGETVARIVTDENGFATTETEEGNAELPYGTYIVKEDSSTTPSGYHAAQEFTVAVTENNKTYPFTIENKTGTPVRIVKQDAETGLQIAGYMTFQILDKNKNPLSFNIPYPSNQIVTNLTTDETGSCTLPESLNGNDTYYLKEIIPPYGYLLNEELVEFSLAEQNSDGVVVVTIKNNPQKGTLQVQKTDAITGQNILQKDIAWNVYADEDIVTADGTVRIKEGTLVAQLKSEKNGSAETESLYLGAYRIEETRAPVGYIQETKPLRVNILYENPPAEVTQTTIDMPNNPLTTKYSALQKPTKHAQAKKTNAKVLAKTGDTKIALLSFFAATITGLGALATTTRYKQIKPTPRLRNK